MPLSDAQKSIAECDSRFRVVIAGRRFGKTFLSIREMARFARYPNRKVVYIAPTYRQAKQIVWNDLCERLQKVNWAETINQSELTVKLKNGSIIMLRSADNFDSLRGLGLDFVIFDEFADIAPETWREVIRPALSDRQGHAMFIGTPKGIGNWAKDLYDIGLDKEVDDWSGFQYTTIDGGNVPQAEIDAAKIDLDQRTFRQEYMASFETYSGVIYYNFEKENNLNYESSYSPGRDIIHIGCDFNTNPMSAVVAVQREWGIEVFDEILIYGSNTYELADEIKVRYPDARQIRVYPDASGGNANTKGLSDHKILQNAGFVVRTPRANPPVKDRIASVNAGLKNANGEIRLLINNKCKRVIECLERQVYKEGTRQPDKDSGYDHMNDALGYMTHWLQPVKKDQPESTGNTYWGPL